MGEAGRRGKAERQGQRRQPSRSLSAIFPACRVGLPSPGLTELPGTAHGSLADDESHSKTASIVPTGRTELPMLPSAYHSTGRTGTKLRIGLAVRKASVAWWPDTESAIRST